MQAATVFRGTLGVCISVLLLSCLVLLPALSPAQESGYLEAGEKYNQEELAQMLAPIALYPDALLSQVLMAATYPIELIEADRWSKQNSQLSGEALDEALLDQDWDPSVKAICHFPSTLALMSERITETTNLGNAFLAQETEVMGMVQRLRSGAYEHGSLKSNAEQQVSVKNKKIIIEPADPRVVYVPYYDPYFVYGSWWWYPAFRPHYWGPPEVNIGVGISYWPGVYFSFVYGGWSYFDWHHNSIYIDINRRPRYVRHSHWIVAPGRWRHVPTHRRGVAYRDKYTARKYGQYPYRSLSFPRDSRGFPDQRRGDQRGSDRRYWTDHDQHRDDLYRQEQQRVERKLKQQQRAEHTEQKRQRPSPEKQQLERKTREDRQQERTEVDRQERLKLAPDRPQRQPADLEGKELPRQRSNLDRQPLKRNPHASSWQESSEATRQLRRTGGPDQQQAEVPDFEAPRGKRESLFHRMGKTKNERKAGERGRYSRNPLNAENRGERNHQQRKWR